MMTGTMYFKAMRLASTATQKQSAGVAAASTGMGASELRPKSAWRRSALSGFGGQSGGRSAALNVTNHERQFGHDGESERLGLQGHAGPGRRGDGEPAGVR